MSGTAVNLLRFSVASLFSGFGFTVYAINLVCDYADSMKCPIFVAYWGFVKYFLKMMFARRSYTKWDYDRDDLDAITRGDAYIDKLVEDFSRDRADEYDPYLIEDSVVGFHKKVVFVNVSGEAKLHDGYIKGLSTLHRPNHCSLHEVGGDRLMVKAELGAGELEFHYSGSVKFMNLGPTITVQGTLSYIEVHMEFTVDSETGKNGKLEKFVIDDMRGMKVWVTGLGPLNWAVNPIITGVTKIFKRFVRNFMENKVEKHIADRIPNFKFPVEGGEETVPPVTEPETNPPTEPETVTEPETNPPTEPETTTEPETNPPTEPETTPEPETNPPTEPETTPEPETNPPTEPETTPTEPETNPPTEPDTTATEPETNPPTEPETVQTEPEIIPTEPEINPEEPETPESENPPESDEEVAYEPDRANRRVSELFSFEESSEEVQNLGDLDEKYISFIDE